MMKMMMVLTFTPIRDLRCSMDDDVKALVKVAVKNEQRIRPVIIHRMPNKRAVGDFGVLSPYLISRERTLKDQKLNIPVFIKISKRLMKIRSLS